MYIYICIYVYLHIYTRIYIHIYTYICTYNDDTYDVVHCQAFVKYTYIHTLTLWARAGPCGAGHRVSWPWGTGSVGDSVGEGTHSHSLSDSLFFSLSHAHALWFFLDDKTLTKRDQDQAFTKREQVSLKELASLSFLSFLALAAGHAAMVGVQYV